MKASILPAGLPQSLWAPPPERIAVFRALSLGDMLCAVPALRALRAAAPKAHITLIGLPSVQAFVSRYSQYVDELMVFPGAPGFPEQPARPEALPAFFAQAQSRKFDLAIQMHGSGKLSNKVVMNLGAARCAGFHRAGRAVSENPFFMPWPEHLPEPLRYLALTRFLGIAEAGQHLEFPLHAQDRDECEALRGELGLVDGRYICLHPGARLLSRRWPLERFAEVGRALIAQGWQVALTGAPDEASLTAELASRLPRLRRGRTGAVDLGGRTTLPNLAALVEASRLVVCNDTGISHVAAAMGRESVVIASGSEVSRWAPLDGRKHRVLWHNVACRPCGYEICPVGHPCALGVTTAAVMQVINEFLAEEISHAA